MSVDLLTQIKQDMARSGGAVEGSAYGHSCPYCRVRITWVDDRPVAITVDEDGE